ncbi:MAG: hypothetical protein HQL80_07105, partial [Magnetococcales bacterium]|nr:hypothetical protein [Magnetococcales bacterium]
DAGLHGLVTGNSTIQHLLVYQDSLFVGVISLRSLANRMTQGRSGKDLMVNVVGGTVLIVILSVIGLLAYLFPDMLAIVQRLSP